MFVQTIEQQKYYLNSIELDLTTYCNLKCNDCSRGCDKFPSITSLSPVDVMVFVGESVKLDKKWIKIGLLGGEPTLHKDLYTILDLLYRYKQYNPPTDIWMMTNASNKSILQYIEEKYEWLRIVRNTNHEHHAFYVSPSDEGLFGTNNLCEGLVCGVGLGPYGYTPCVLGTFLTRIFDYPTMATIKDITYERCQSLFGEYCKHCGWYLVDSYDRSKGKIYEYPKGYISYTWQNFYDTFNSSADDIVKKIEHKMYIDGI